ncbi:hypothetical protein HIM_07512 [Hirsutella minnesotensis 3608]|uniref:Uncharacterized protein n=1 Tax=Hirsutella minnesotensis 3608 TaxID=1043627 RepID=A0A0F7ZTH6_9HYPO|nr:hypothetical protein HIM_07512 [Hirsutella minnesotensis 3608]
MDTPAPVARTSPRRRLRRTPPRHAKGSLYDILRRHPRTSLFVRPICWTDQHSRLLGVRFNKLPPCDSPVPIHTGTSSPSKGQLYPSTAIIRLSGSLSDVNARHSPQKAANAIDIIVKTLWPAVFGETDMFPDLSIFFGDRVYREAARAQTMWSDPAHKKPMACFISKFQLAAMRRNIFRVTFGPNRSFNEPVTRLQRARSRMLMPSDPDHDVQIAAIFLAMAQAHFYPKPTGSSKRDSPWHKGPGKPSRPRFRDLTLRVITSNKEVAADGSMSADASAAEFTVYTGHVTARFLERFHEPQNSPQDDGEDGLRIDYTRVPIWPILGLKERMGLALGRDLVGDFDPTVMEQWGEDEVPSSGEERKREILSEVFKASFDETTDEEPRVNAIKNMKKVKKRRIGESSSVGVVAT